MWGGANLEARLSLMRYMLKRLRDWKRRAKAKEDHEAIFGKGEPKAPNHHIDPYDLAA
jgi:hypothetical protein